MMTLLETSALAVLSSVLFPSPPPAPRCGLGELDLIYNSIDDTESLLDPLPPLCDRPTRDLRCAI
jgi:hypothetical protein